MEKRDKKNIIKSTAHKESLEKDAKKSSLLYSTVKKAVTTGTAIKTLFDGVCKGYVQTICDDSKANQK